MFKGGKFIFSGGNSALTFQGCGVWDVLGRSYALKEKMDEVVRKRVKGNLFNWKLALVAVERVEQRMEAMGWKTWWRLAQNHEHIREDEGEGGEEDDDDEEEEEVLVLSEEEGENEEEEGEVQEGEVGE